jgi:hypothetical protein
MQPDIPSDKLFPVSELYKAMKPLGLATGKCWVIRHEKRGDLKLRRTPSSNLKKVTEKDIFEIIRAYSPGGTGRWHWDTWL